MFSVFAVCDVTGSMVAYDIVHNMTITFIYIYSILTNCHPYTLHGGISHRSIELPCFYNHT